MRNPETEPAGCYDVFFSAHVIEHVPSVSRMLTLGLRLLRPGGLFVAFTPNASPMARQARPGPWSKLWGFVHPQLIDEEYLNEGPLPAAWCAASDPYPQQEIRAWRRSGRELRMGVGGEMFFAAVKPEDGADAGAQTI